MTIRQIGLFGLLLAAGALAAEKPAERPVWAVREWRGAPGCGGTASR